MAHYSSFGEALQGGKDLMARDERIEDYHPVQLQNGKWILSVLAKRQNISDLHGDVQEYQSAGFIRPSSGVPAHKKPPSSAVSAANKRPKAPSKPVAPPPPPPKPQTAPTAARVAPPPPRPPQ